MKKIRLFFVLSLSIAAAQAAEKEVKLLGVTSGFGRDSAVIGIWNVAKNSSEIVVLKAGQSLEEVQVMNIDAAKGAVSLKVSGEDRQISLPADGNYGSTNKLDPTLPVMYFHELPLQSAIVLYADYKKSTVLIHPKLGAPTFSLKINPRTKDEAAAALEKLFSDQNVATIPDGKHFVMVVPFAFTNSVTPRSSALPQTNSLIPEMSINFHDCPDGAVLQTYADLVHKEIVNRDDGGITCCNTVTFVQITPISRDELCYALETLMEWHNIRMAPAGEGKLKLERISNR